MFTMFTWCSQDAGRNVLYVIMRPVRPYCRIAEVTEGKSTIPFATELETGKWLYDSDKCVTYTFALALSAISLCTCREMFLLQMQKYAV